MKDSFILFQCLTLSCFLVGLSFNWLSSLLCYCPQIALLILMVILGAIPILGHLIMMIGLAKCGSTKVQDLLDVGAFEFIPNVFYLSIPFHLLQVECLILLKGVTHEYQLQSVLLGVFSSTIVVCSRYSENQLESVSSVCSCRSVEA